MTVDYVRTQICQMYINMDADGTWAKELAEVSQIIALTTQVNALSTKLNSTIALATPTSKPSEKASNPSTKTKRVNGHYTVADWRLKKDSDSKIGPYGNLYHWFTEGH